MTTSDEQYKLWSPKNILQGKKFKCDFFKLPHLYIEESVEFLIFFSSQSQIFCFINLSCFNQQGYNPLHLACFGGHITVVGLLLSRSAELLQSGDKHGKTGLHIAANHGRYQMCEVLLGQGAEINATDKVSDTGVTMMKEASN